MNKTQKKVLAGVLLAVLAFLAVASIVWDSAMDKLLGAA